MKIQWRIDSGDESELLIDVTLKLRDDKLIFCNSRENFSRGEIWTYVHLELSDLMSAAFFHDKETYSLELFKLSGT